MNDPSFSFKLVLVPASEIDVKNFTNPGIRPADRTLKNQALVKLRLDIH